jgi:GNAT superfamily N-acetyltransferase
MAFEYGLFVAPEHRGGSAGPRLARAFIEWSKEHGAAVINMGITTGVHAERTGSFIPASVCNVPGCFIRWRFNDVYWC